MKKILILLYVLIFGFIGTANALIVNFDDLSDPNTAYLPSSYKGFNWDSNWGFVNNTWLKGFSGSTFDVPSLQNAAFNIGATTPLNVGNEADFDFLSAEFAGWKGYASTSITVNGYNNGALVGTASMALSTDGSFSTLNANLFGVDELEFISSGGSGDRWLMDDFTYAPVPEPATMLLLGTGLIGLAGFGRKKILKRK